MSQSTLRASNVFVSCLMNDSYAPVVSHLINYLKNDGIGVVIGRVEIGPGEPMDATLRRSIEDCDIYVIVFSKNYATSNSRLWEVAAIAEAAEAMGKRILPVFYGVKAEDVKLRTDKYVKQLNQHRFLESAVTTDKWRNALQRTAQFLGLNRPISDADLCQEIRGRVRDFIREKDQSVVTLKATIRGCPNLRSIKNLGLGSASRTFLTLDNVGISSLELQSQSKNLTERITIRNCQKFKEVWFGQWKSMKVFDIDGCPSIESLSDVGSAGKLEELSVSNCQNLKVIEGLEDVVGSLKSININNCDSLESVASKLLKIPRDRNNSSCNSQDTTIESPGEPDEESERSNSTPTPSSIISASADHDEAKVEMHQLASSQGVSSSTSLTETTTTQLKDAEELIIEELNRLIELD